MPSKETTSKSACRGSDGCACIGVNGQRLENARLIKVHKLVYCTFKSDYNLLNNP